MKAVIDNIVVVVSFVRTRDRPLKDEIESDDDTSDDTDSDNENNDTGGGKKDGARSALEQACAVAGISIPGLPVLPLQLDALPRSQPQLILTYCGETWTFQDVTKAKVDEALRILRSADGVGEAGAPSERNRIRSTELASTSYEPTRQGVLRRFKEKKKLLKEKADRPSQRDPSKPTVRQEVAAAMRRVNGQFARPTGPNGRLHSECVNCHMKASDTPLMRRGPDGSRSLCNACGIIFRKYGELPDPNKKSRRQLRATVTSPQTTGHATGDERGARSDTFQERTHGQPAPPGGAQPEATTVPRFHPPVVKAPHS